MIKSWKDGEIVYFQMEGEFLADELITESDKWLKEQDSEFLGYLVDIRNMTKQSALEQKKAEAAAKKNQSGKVRAVLGKDTATAAIVNIYTRFTGAEGVRYFTNEQEAKDWILGFKKS